MELSSISQGQYVINAGYVLAALAAFFIARMIFEEQESHAASEALDQRERQTQNTLVRWTRPFFTNYVVPMIRGKSMWDNLRKQYKRKVVAAGLRDQLNADEFISFKLFLILFFPLVGTALKAAGLIDVGFMVVLGSGVVGWFYPDFWANGLINERRSQVLKAMPFIIDLLALSTEAGLDFVGAIGKVVEKAKPSPLVEEFGQILKEMKVGSSRTDALREMAYRLDMPEVNSFVAILISAEQMGAPIGRILRQQSEQMRVDRMLRAEKAGAAASQKIMLPVVLFIMPAVMLMIFGPFAIEYFK